MQPKRIFTILTITFTVFVLNFFRESTELATLPVGKIKHDQNISESKPINRDQFFKNFQHFQNNQQHWLQKSQLQQSRINDILTKMDIRLRALENRDNQRSNHSLETIDPVHQADNQTLTSDEPQKQQVSEADIEHWMTSSLLNHGQNQETTEQAINQAEKTLEKIPNVTLEDMQCGDRFCLAEFSHNKGEKTDLGSIFGEPPFQNGGFTINKPDGTVALYFAQPGESIENFRRETELELQD